MNGLMCGCHEVDLDDVDALVMTFSPSDTQHASATNLTDKGQTENRLF